MFNHIVQQNCRILLCVCSAFLDLIRLNWNGKSFQWTFCLVNACFSIMHLTHQSDRCDKTHTCNVHKSKAKAIHKTTENLWWKTAATDIRMDKKQRRSKKYGKFNETTNQREQHYTKQIIIVISPNNIVITLSLPPSFSLVLFLFSQNFRKRNGLSSLEMYVTYVSYMLAWMHVQRAPFRSYLSDTVCVFSTIILTRGDINKIMDVSLSLPLWMRIATPNKGFRGEKNLLIYFSAIAINMNSRRWQCMSQIEKNENGTWKMVASRYESVLAFHLIVSTFYVDLFAAVLFILFKISIIPT